MCAKDNQFGQFQFEVSGPIEAVRQVHLSGQVSRPDQAGNVLSEWGCFGKDHVFCFSTDWSKFSLNHCGIFVVSAIMPVTLHLKLNTISIEKENLKRIEIRRILNNEKNMARKMNVISQD